MPKKPTTGLGLFLYTVRRLFRKAVMFVVLSTLGVVSVLTFFIILVAQMT